MRPTIHTMLRRYQNWDYRSRAIYMITLSLANRRSNALGELVIDSPPGTPPREVKAHVALSKLGEGVLELWKRQSAFVPQIKPLFGMVMPDHFHGILQVAELMAKPLGIAIGAFKGACTRLWRELLPAAQNEYAHATASSLFSDGFNDKILFRAGELGAWLDYLADNPRLIAKSGAADINYRGIKPADIDRLVQEACAVQPVAGEGRAA